MIYPFIFTRNTNNNRLDATGKNSLVALGDSITQGQNASPTTLSYINRYRTLYNFTTFQNASVSSRGVWNQANAVQGLTFTRSLTVISCLIGLNDIRRNSSATKTLAKIEACYRTIILKGLANAVAQSGSTGVTRSGGTFTGFSANTVGGTGTGGALPGATRASFSTDGGDWSWTFSGTAFGIQFIANSGDVETYGTCDIYIDSVFNRTIDLNVWYDNVSDGAYDNRRGPLAFTWHGLTNASHTIEVRTTNTGNPVVVDFFCSLQSVANSASFIFSEIPYLDATGYATSPSLGSVAASDAGSAVIRSLVTEYRALGYNIAYVQWNKFYNLSTGLDTADHIHPNNTGHGQGLEAFKAVTLK